MSSPVSESPKTVLLVEDLETVRKLLQTVLESQGYQVLPADDGQTGLETAERHPGPIHLLVTDVLMPRMGGRELASHLSRLRPETRVLFISGYVENDPAEMNRFVEEGAYFLSKPFSPAVLIETVQGILEANQG